MSSDSMKNNTKIFTLEEMFLDEALSTKCLSTTIFRQNAFDEVVSAKCFFDQNVTRWMIQDFLLIISSYYFKLSVIRKKYHLNKREAGI